MKLKTLVAALSVGLGSFAAVAQTANTGPVKIGFITDMSSLYADIDGPAGGEMIRWAVQDFGGKVLNRPVEVLTADHQNKADVAGSKAREWMDKENLAMLVGGTSSGTNLAMAKVAQEKKRPFISIGAGGAVDVRVEAGHVGDDADAHRAGLGLGHRAHAGEAGDHGGDEGLEFHDRGLLRVKSCCGWVAVRRPGIPAASPCSRAARAARIP